LFNCNGAEEKAKTRGEEKEKRNGAGGGGKGLWTERGGEKK